MERLVGEVGAFLGYRLTGHTLELYPMRAPRRRGTPLRRADGWSLHQTKYFAGVPLRVVDVRFGSLADILASPRHVRFTPNNGHWAAHPILLSVYEYTPSRPTLLAAYRL